MFYDIENMMPQVQRTGDMITPEKTIASFSVRRNYNYLADMPANGSYIEPYGYFKGYTLDESPGYNIIRMEFSGDVTTGQSSASRNDRKPGDVVWQFAMNAFERDIRLHPNYKTYWSYYLCAAPGIATTLPYWSMTATDNILSVADRIKYKWVSDIDSIPEGWACIQQRKKTAESYYDAAITCTRTTYYSNYDTAEANLYISVHLECPPRSTIGDKTASHWLLVGSNPSADGNLFTVVDSWQYWPHGYDTEIYQ